ncbi:MAG: ABC-F family ATP-binding cassette domain-containing protein [Acidaminococcaceae bacterium]|nr:ABC-F family ATP-binding cassette domain-containing protein [Acidaminococcaceae bacterium]
MQLVVDNVAKAFGINEIFKNVSFMVEQGEHLGLVGVNGSGKTTLLRCLLNPEYVDKGAIKFEPGTSVGYVQQGFTDIEGTIWQFMLKSCPGILGLREKLQQLEEASAELDGAELDEVLEEYARVTKRYEHMDGYNLETRIKRVLIGLGYKEDWWEKDAATLSGGQKTRLMLAAALVRNPDFMILDEPTNHLDILMTQWLEGYLREFRGGLIVVSHDRAFLDNVAIRILEMEGGKLQSFKGNYSKYLEQKAIQTQTLEAAYNAQQDYIARTEAYIRRFKAGIKSKMARGRQSQLDRLERIDAPVYNEEFELRLPPAAECADRVLIMEDLTIGYGDNVLAKGINLTLRRGEKAALMGANGTGKTTLLKTILGEVEPLKGRAKIGNRVQIGYFSQTYERLNPKQTLLENFVIEYGFTEEHTRSMLGGMLFHGDDVFKEIGTLSGGQKARLVLLKLVLDGANCLVLDEPTNHLDIMARETVEAALTAFDGTVLVVSHDRYFINEVANRIWEIEDGQVKDYKGNYEFYQEERAKEAALVAEREAELEKQRLYAEQQAKKNVPQVTSVKVEAKNKQRRYSSDEAKKLLPKVELSIREQEAMMKLLEMKMADPANHADPAQSAAMAAEHDEYENKIMELMEKWEQLMEASEE